MRLKNFSDSHPCATERATRYPRHPLGGLPQQSFRNYKARLPHPWRLRFFYGKSKYVIKHIDAYSTDIHNNVR